MVKKRGVVWNYYNKKVDGATVIAFCKFCERSYIQNATRMEKHLARCEKATPEVKQLFLRVSTSKRVNRARLLGAKMPINWLKHNSEYGLDVTTLTEADLEDINEWNRQKEMANEEEAVESILLTEEEQIETGWENIEDEAESPTKKIKEAASSAKEWIKQTHKIEPMIVTPSVTLPETPSKLGQKLSTEPMKRTHQIPILPKSSSTQLAAHYSPLQTKILQEQLFEKRATRKIAEMELRRKALELERAQWEYERDKAQSDVRWEHETRMMEIKEERERKLIENPLGNEDHTY